ncbi:SpoIIE family protein phosphatase OS=Streptomyces tendae OX=1932 GN=GUR47_04685 PE=4 SV=1 [Streptomyces tendae]
MTDVARVQRLAAALATAGTVRDVSQAVVAALRRPLRADRIALAELENDRLVVAIALDPPDPESWPELWRLEWRTEWPGARRYGPCPPSPPRCARAAPGSGPPAPATWNRPCADVGPGGLAVLPLPAGGCMAGACLIGWDAPHDFGPDERALLTASAGLAGQALMRAHAFDAEHELVGMLQRQLLPRRLPKLARRGRRMPVTCPAPRAWSWAATGTTLIPLPGGHVGACHRRRPGPARRRCHVMGQLRIVLRAYAAEGHPPATVMARASVFLHELDTDRFATCVYAEADLGTEWSMVRPRRAHATGAALRRRHLRPRARSRAGCRSEWSAVRAPRLSGEPRWNSGPGTRCSLCTTTAWSSRRGPTSTRAWTVRSRPDHLRARRRGAGRRRSTGRRAPRRRRRAAGAAPPRPGPGPLRESWSVWRLPEAVRHARRFTRRTLRSWDVPDDAVDGVLLIVSELVTNALVHTDGKVRLDLTLISGRLRVAVADASPRTPVKPTSIGWEATGGTGILLSCRPVGGLDAAGQRGQAGVEAQSRVGG